MRSWNHKVQTCKKYTCRKSYNSHIHSRSFCQLRYRPDQTHRKYTGHRSCIRHNHRYSLWMRWYIPVSSHIDCNYRRRLLRQAGIPRYSLKSFDCIQIYRRNHYTFRRKNHLKGYIYQNNWKKCIGIRKGKHILFDKSYLQRDEPRR